MEVRKQVFFFLPFLSLTVRAFAESNIDMKLSFIVCKKTNLAVNTTSCTLCTRCRNLFLLTYTHEKGSRILFDMTHGCLKNFHQLRSLSVFSLGKLDLAFLQTALYFKRPRHASSLSTYMVVLWVLRHINTTF